MNKEKSVRMSRLGLFHISDLHFRMGRAAAVNQLDVFVGKLIFDISSEVYVGNEKNVLFGHGSNNLHGRGGGYADVANGFELGGGVDVGDDGITGIHAFELFDDFSVHLLGHGAACVLVGEIDRLFGRKNFNRFGHKTHSAHNDRLVGNGGRLFCKGIAVAHKIGNFGYLAALIGMGKNTNVLFLFKPQYFVLHIKYFHFIHPSVFAEYFL